MGENGRRVEQTPHFRIHVAPGSFAEANLAHISDRLEGAHAAFAAGLALDGGGAPIEVFLADLLDDPQRPGTPLPGGGYALVRRRQLYEVYRQDAPGDSLERSLLLVLLADAAGESRPWPPPLVYGILAHLDGGIGALEADEQTRPALVAARRRLPPALGLLTGPVAPSGGIAFLAAGSVVGFLLGAHGPAQFREFLRRLGPEGADAAARAAFGAEGTAIDRAWRKSLTAKPAAVGVGIGRFVRLSLGYLSPYKLKVAEIVLYLVLSVGFGIGVARMQGLLLDRAIIPRDLSALGAIMAILVAAYALVQLTSLRESYLTAWVAESVMRELRLQIFERLQRMHPGFFQQMQSGDILSRMTSDLAMLDFAFTGALAQGLSLVLTLVLASVTIFTQDWKLALLAIVATPLFFLVNKLIGPAADRASLERQELEATATSTLQENLAAQPVVKAFGLQDRAVGAYRTNLDALTRSALRLTFLSSLLGLSAGAITSAINLTVLGVGAYFAIGGSLTPGTLFTFLALMSQVIGPIQSISSTIQMLQQASGSLTRVEELLHAEPAIADAPGARPLAPLREAIRLEGVTFSYTGGQPQLRELDLAIPAGANVALVGPSGCGKSTVLNLLLRFYDPQGGRVTFDGCDLRAATLESVRGQMGVVFQDNFLFDSSIRENIRMGDPTASDAAVEAAARAAEIHEMIVAMPEGYDTIVGERGGRLSGGQRQRIAIARAIIRNPTLLLLDEATSALDPRTEAAINETLDRLARGRTTISVTHRLASVVNATRIFVLDGGRLVEEGTHDDLVARGGLYATLWQEQGGFDLRSGVQRVGVEAARLGHVPLFASLDPALLGALAARLAVERFPAGETIVAQGEAGDKLYLLHRGQAEVLAADPGGRLRPLAVLREGDHFGELALLYDLPRAATVRAKTPVQLYSLEKATFDALLASAPHLRDRIARTVAQQAQVDAGR